MGWINRTLYSAAAASVAYVGISGLMARGLTRAIRIRPDDTPATVGLPYESVSFPSRAGDLNLSGWLCPPPGCTDMNDALAQRWVVLMPGFGSHTADAATGILGLARDLHDRNFGVLLFNPRASGNSGGARGSAGFYERFDLLGAIDYLFHRGVDADRTGVVGLSLGGAVALTICSAPGVVAAVIADSSFADLNMMICRAQQGVMKPLAFFNPGMRFAARYLYGIDTNEVSPAGSLSVSEVPTLIIHGENDRVVPVSHARLLARAAGINSPGRRDAEIHRLWIAAGAGHVEAYRRSPAEYVERITEFLDAHLASGVSVRTAT